MALRKESVTWIRIPSCCWSRDSPAFPDPVTRDGSLTSPGMSPARPLAPEFPEFMKGIGWKRLRGEWRRERRERREHPRGKGSRGPAPAGPVRRFGLPVSVPPRNPLFLPWGRCLPGSRNRVGVSQDSLSCRSLAGHRADGLSQPATSSLLHISRAQRCSCGQPLPGKGAGPRW